MEETDRIEENHNDAKAKDAERKRKILDLRFNEGSDGDFDL